MKAANVEETLKDFWASRPRRPHRGRKIAGVAAGIAERYQIDPVIVRVAFVAMALCNGAGVFIYLLGWLGLPQEDDEVSPVEALIGQGRSSTPIPLTVLLCLALFPATGFFFDGGFTMVAGVLLSVGAVYLLHLNRGSVNRPVPLTTNSSAEQVTEMGQEKTATPPAWDPLGAAPFAWDLPEPGQSMTPVPPPAPVRRYKRKSPVTGITLGLSLMVVATAVITGRGDTWFTPLHTLGVVVAIMGVGLLVGSFVRGGRGLIGLVIPLSLVGVLGTVVNLADLNGNGRVGDISPHPTSIAEVDSEYVLKAGSIQLDLTGLPNAGQLETEVRTVVGTVQVTVPKTADVEVRCEADLGSVQCLGQESNGTDAEVETTDLGTDGQGGLKIVLNVRNGVGDVQVNRG